MFRINSTSWIIILFFSLLADLAYGRQKYTFTRKEMGSPFTVTIYTADSVGAARAAGRAFTEVSRLNLIFSDYLDSSELNRLSYTGGTGKYIQVSPELFDMLRRSVEASRMSGGAFDITVGPLVAIWRQARRDGKFPSGKARRQAKRAVGYRFIHLDTTRSAAMLEKSGMRLDLGGIAKGYAAQAALDVVRREGFHSAMVNAGGDLALGDPPPGRPAWRIGISIPETYDEIMQKNMLVENRAVATSGDIYQYFEWKGKRYSHIINPKTGYGVTRRRNVTVIAADGAVADWLASACSVLSIPAALRLAGQIPGAAVLIAEKQGNRIYRISSDGFERFYEK